MDNIFYFLGILYFITSAYNFFSYDHNRDVSINTNTNISELNEESEKYKCKNPEKYYPRQLIGFLFFIWTYIGCVGGFPEKKFFILNFLVLILNALVLISMGILLAFKAFNKITNRCDFTNENKSEKTAIPLTKGVYFLEMLIVGTICTIHYFIL